MLVAAPRPWAFGKARWFMARVVVTVDDKLVERAKSALGTKTPQQTVVQALKDAASRVRLRGVVEHMGKVDLGITSDDVVRLREET